MSRVVNAVSIAGAGGLLRGFPAGLALAKSYDARGQYFGSPAARLKIKSVLAKVRAGTRQRMVCYGDSNTFGNQATGTYLKAQSYPTFMAAAMALGGVPTDTDSFMGMGAASTAALYNTYNPQVAMPADWVPGTASIGGSTFYCPNTVTSSFDFTPVKTVDTFDVWYYRASGQGTFTLSINGGAALATVNSNGSTGVVKATITFTPGTPTINIERTTGGPLNLIGGEAYNSAVPTLSIINAGYPGATSATLADASITIRCLNALGALVPDYVVAMIGINDWQTGSAVTPAQFRTNMEAIRTKALLTGGYSQIVPFATQTTNASIANQQLYIDQLRAMSATLDIPMLDINWATGTWDQVNAVGLNADPNHRLAAGYALLGSEEADFLLTA